MFSSGSPPVLGDGYISQRLYSVITQVQVALPPFKHRDKPRRFTCLIPAGGT